MEVIGVTAGWGLGWGGGGEGVEYSGNFGRSAAIRATLFDFFLPHLHTSLVSPLVNEDALEAFHSLVSRFSLFTDQSLWPSRADRSPFSGLTDVAPLAVRPRRSPGASPASGAARAGLTLGALVTRLSRLT